MDITFNCGSCGQSLSIDEAGAGQLVDCPKCAKPLEVPYKSESLNGVARANLRVATLAVPQPSAAVPSKRPTRLNETARPGALAWRRIIVIASGVAVLVAVAVALKYWQTGRQPTASESGVASDLRQQGEEIKALEQRVTALEASQSAMHSEVESAEQTAAGAVGLTRRNEKRMEDQRREDRNRENQNRLNQHLPVLPGPGDQ